MQLTHRQYSRSVLDAKRWNAPVPARGRGRVLAIGRGLGRHLFQEPPWPDLALAPPFARLPAREARRGRRPPGVRGAVPTPGAPPREGSEPDTEPDRTRQGSFFGCFPTRGNRARGCGPRAACQRRSDVLSSPTGCLRGCVADRSSVLAVEVPPGATRATRADHVERATAEASQGLRSGSVVATRASHTSRCRGTRRSSVRPASSTTLDASTSRMTAARTAGSASPRTTSPPVESRADDCIDGV